MDFKFDSNLVVARDPTIGIYYISGKHRRTAGRPRAGTQSPPIAIYGNSQGGPMVPESTHEILLSTPLVKVLNMLRTFLSQYGIINLTLKFRANGLHITEATEKRGVSSGFLSLFLDARFVHYYHCAYPINLRISRDQFNNALCVMRNETHYGMLRVKPLPGSRTHMGLEIFVHMTSDSLAENQMTQYEALIVPNEEVIHLPPPQDYYSIEFQIDNTGFKNFIKNQDDKNIVMMKSANTNLRIYHERGSETRLEIPNSSNILYNHLQPEQVLTVVMPVYLAQTFSQAGDQSTHLRIAVHPTDPVVLSYYVENTQIRTQYKNMEDRKINAAVMRLYVLPVSE